MSPKAYFLVWVVSNKDVRYIGGGGRDERERRQRFQKERRI